MSRLRLFSWTWKGQWQFNKIKCLSCNKDYSNKIDEELKKWFKNKFKFSINDINKFILLLRKDVYPSEYMDEWEKFNETSLKKKNFIAT